MTREEKAVDLVKRLSIDCVFTTFTQGLRKISVGYLPTQPKFGRGMLVGHPLILSKSVDVWQHRMYGYLRTQSKLETASEKFLYSKEPGTWRTLDGKRFRPIL